MPIRGILTAEDFEKEIAAADAEMRACKTVEDLKEVWVTHFGRLGHKALGRLLIGMPAEAVIAKRAKAVSHLPVE